MSDDTKGKGPTPVSGDPVATESAERLKQMADEAAARKALEDRVTRLEEELTGLKDRPQPRPIGVPLAGIKIGQDDGRGRTVAAILAGADDYVVYRAIDGAPAPNGRAKKRQSVNSHVVVHLSDDPNTSKGQNDRLSQVGDLRVQVGGLLNSRWRDPAFERALAEALGLAVDSDVPGSRARLADLLQQLRTESLRIGQAYQMAFSCVAWAWFVALLFVFSRIAYPFTDISQDVWLAAKGGATGALFSIATQYNNRVLAPDTKKIRIALEAFIRIGTGVTAGGALLFALSSGIFTHPVGGETSVTIANWMYVAVIGFLAGFAEKLVPSLFENLQFDPDPKAKPGAIPASGQAPVGTAGPRPGV